MIQVTDNATPAVKRVIDSLDAPARERLSKVLGEGLVTDLSKWFASKAREPNRRGWPKRGFWARIRRATALDYADATGAQVAISDPAIRLKVYGGTVRPKEAKWLAIPMTAEAYKAERPGLMVQPLFPLMIGGRLMLADTDDKSDDLTVHWLLVKSTTHKPDPTALPTKQQMETSTLRRAESWISRNAKIA